jgi:hypothetical protein
MWGGGEVGVVKQKEFTKYIFINPFLKDKAIPRTYNNQSTAFLFLNMLITASEQSKFMTYILIGVLLLNVTENPKVTQRKWVLIR